MIQIYGNYTCEHCMTILSGLTQMDIPFVFLDADKPQFEDLLDSLDVELLPFVRILDDKGTVIFEKSGKVSLTEIVKQCNLIPNKI